MLAALNITNRKTILFTFSICSLAFFSCSDTGPQVAPCNESTIIDEWIWVKSEGGVGGLYLTPENTGWNIRLEISDSIWREFKNDTLTFESKYSFTPDTNGLFYGGDLDFEDRLAPNVEIIHCLLNLQYGFEDTPINYYQRQE